MSTTPNHPTPRTDALSFNVDFDSVTLTELKKATDLARQLEQELAECRLRLAGRLTDAAYAEKRALCDEEADALHAAAAHLRNLKTPLDPSKL